MCRVELDRAWPCDRLPDDLAALELISGQVQLDPRGEPVPHVRLSSLAIEIHTSRAQLASEQVVDHERRDIAVAAAGVLGRPIVVLGSVAPQLARIACSSCASVNTARFPNSYATSSRRGFGR